MTFFVDIISGKKKGIDKPSKFSKQDDMFTKKTRKEDLSKFSEVESESALNEPMISSTNEGIETLIMKRSELSIITMLLEIPMMFVNSLLVFILPAFLVAASLLSILFFKPAPIAVITPDMAKKIVDKMKELKDAFLEEKARAKKQYDLAKEFIRESFSDIIRGITSDFNKIWERVKDMTSNLFESAKDFFTEIYRTVMDSMKTAVENILDLIKKTFGDPTNDYTKLKTKIEEGSRIVYEELMKEFNGITSSLIEIKDMTLKGLLDSYNEIKPSIEFLKEFSSKVSKFMDYSSVGKDLTPSGKALSEFLSYKPFINLLVKTGTGTIERISDYYKLLLEPKNYFLEKDINFVKDLVPNILGKSRDQVKIAKTATGKFLNTKGVAAIEVVGNIINYIGMVEVASEYSKNIKEGAPVARETVSTLIGTGVSFGVSALGGMIFGAIAIIVGAPAIVTAIAGLVGALSFSIIEGGSTKSFLDKYLPKDLANEYIKLMGTNFDYNKKLPGISSLFSNLINSGSINGEGWGKKLNNNLKKYDVDKLLGDYVPPIVDLFDTYIIETIKESYSYFLRDRKSGTFDWGFGFLFSEFVKDLNTLDPIGVTIKNTKAIQNHIVEMNRHAFNIDFSFLNNDKNHYRLMTSSNLFTKDIITIKMDGTTISMFKNDIAIYQLPDEQLNTRIKIVNYFINNNYKNSNADVSNNLQDEVNTIQENITSKLQVIEKESYARETSNRISSDYKGSYTDSSGVFQSGVGNLATKMK